MRKLLNTLFVTSEDKYLALENQNVVVWNGDERVAQYPLVMLEGIVTFSYKGASPALMGACAERNIQLTFLHPAVAFWLVPAAWRMAMSCCAAPSIERQIQMRKPAASPGT